MSNERIGWGIIGCGVIGPWHAQAITGAEGAELVAVCDIVEQKAKKLGEEYSVPYVTDINEFLAREDVQAVSICTPSGMHAEQAIAAAEAGKHILCEKPLDITLERIDAMIEAAAANNVKLAGVFQRRTLPSSQRVREAVRGGKLGKVVLGDCYQKYYRSHEYYASGEWRATWDLDGGGALMNQGVHGVDLLLWIMGDVARVSGYCRRLVRNIDVEDTAVAMVEFANGALGVLEATTSVTPGYAMALEVHGDTGSIKMASDEITTWAIAGEEEQTAEATGAGTAADPTALSTYGHQHHVADLCQAITEDRPPQIPGHEARKAVELIKAIYLSSREGGAAVELPLAYDDDGPGIYPSVVPPPW